MFGALWLVSVVVLMLFTGRGRLRRWQLYAYIALFDAVAFATDITVRYSIRVDSWRTKDNSLIFATPDVAP